MLKRTRFIIILSIAAALLVLIVITAVVINSPYYPGFESRLSYLSPDLSEYSTLIRDSVFLPRKSEIKIVFEEKNRYIEYDRSQFNNFMNNVVIQVWNDSEYYSFNSNTIEYIRDFSGDFQLSIGFINGKGKYNIYINSNDAINATYNIGLGIGNESRFRPIGRNVRDFY